jgi:hypothetical protein
MTVSFFKEVQMRKIRFWIETLAVGAVVICTTAAFVAAPGAVRGKAASPPQLPQAQTASVPTQGYEGVITDTHCNAKHSAAIGMTASDCTRVCVHGGEHFALVDGETVYTLEGEPAALKQVAGQRVKIVGTLMSNKISVASVSAN